MEFGVYTIGLPWHDNVTAAADEAPQPGDSVWLDIDWGDDFETMAHKFVVVDRAWHFDESSFGEQAAAGEKRLQIKLSHPQTGCVMECNWKEMVRDWHAALRRNWKEMVRDWHAALRRADRREEEAE